MKSTFAACVLLVGGGHAIGQTLNGTPIGHQQEKDHVQESLAEHVNPQTGKVQHEHIADYDSFIKHQTEPSKKPTQQQQHHEDASKTLQAATATHTAAPLVSQTPAPATTAEIKPMPAQAPVAQVPVAPDRKSIQSEQEAAEKKFYEVRRAEKEARREEQSRHKAALAKYEASLESKSKSPPGATVGHLQPAEQHRNDAVPIVDSDQTGEAKQRKRTSQYDISSTQAILLIGMLCFLLFVALIICAIGWVANLMIKMQKHEVQIQELTRQNTNLRNGENTDLEANKSPKKAAKGKKEEAYGRFEDEIKISQGSFRENEHGNRKSILSADDLNVI